MLADLDLLLIAVFCTADDLLPEAVKNARRMLTDAEVVTLAVAQAIMGIPSDARFLKIARKQLAHLFPALPNRPGYLSAGNGSAEHDRGVDHRLRERQPRLPRRPGAGRLDPGRVRPLLETTPGASPTARRRRRLRLLRQPQPLLLGLPPAPPVRPRRHPARADPDLAENPERDVCLDLLERCQRDGHLFVLGDKGYAGREFEPSAAASTPRSSGQNAKTSPAKGPHIAPIRQRIESIFQTCKDLLTLERHGARTLHGLDNPHQHTLPRPRRRDRLNHRLGRPSRALVDYTA